MKNKVVLELSKKEIKSLPRYIHLKLLKWAQDVESIGIKEVRKAKGWHDEPLKGKRNGQRSIRLNRSYRAIYIEEDNQIIVIIEANKHDY